MVLVVDDRPENRYVVCRILKKADYTTLEAATGEEAIQQARQHRPDAIVLDMNLGGETGIDVLKQLRAEAQTASIPVVILTATAHSSYDRNNAESAGASAYLFNPVEPDTLVSVVTGIIERPKQ